MSTVWLLPRHGLELRDEPGGPDDPTAFPHIYGGNLPLAVIAEAVPVTVTRGVLEDWRRGELVTDAP